MNYCSQCGSDALVYRTPEGDNRPRFICSDCQYIHYQNPKMVVGCLPVYEGKILLCRRGIEPMKGHWNLPAGFMENGESAEEGAIRETLEEANAKVDLIRLHTVYSVVHVNQVYLIFLVKLRSPHFSPGQETLETQLFAPEDIPFEDIAFSSNVFTLKRYLTDPESTEVHLGSYTAKV